jgi:hypothetical protein
MINSLELFRSINCNSVQEGCQVVISLNSKTLPLPYYALQTQVDDSGAGLCPGSPYRCALAAAHPLESVIGPPYPYSVCVGAWGIPFF